MTPVDLVVTPAGCVSWGGIFLHRGACRREPIPSEKATGRHRGGVHGLIGMLWRPDRLARPTDWAVPIGPCDLWSDDPGDEDYNLMVRAPYDHSHERLRRPDPLYDLVILTDWNWPGRNGAAGPPSLSTSGGAPAPRPPLCGAVAGVAWLDRAAHQRQVPTDRPLTPGAARPLLQENTRPPWGRAFSVLVREPP